MGTIAWEYRPLSWYVEQLESRTPLAMSRWGDGEWSCLLGAEGRNCDGHTYSQALCDDLTSVLERQPRYLCGLQGLAMRKMGSAIGDWSNQHCCPRRWVDGDVFHRASAKGELAPLIAALRDRGVILVGPDRISQLGLFPVASCVGVPLRNCHDDVTRVVDETVRSIDVHGTEPVVSVSASMSANVVVDCAHRARPHATVIDFGSLWEPYVGIANRTYHRGVIQRLNRESQR